MKHQLQTIRENAERIRLNVASDPQVTAEKILNALAEIERMAGEQVPVLFIHPSTLNMDSAHVGAWRPGHELEGYIPLYLAPPVQQAEVVPKLRSGYQRQWVRCRTCGRVAHYDYVPHSLSRPIMTMPCGHGAGERDMGADRITEEAALSILAAPQQAEAVPWTHDDLDGMVEALRRVIEVHYATKSPFHNPVYADARMAHRILMGYLPYMKHAKTPQQAEAVPPGYVLVPVEPNEEIMRAVYGYTVEVDTGGVQTLYPSEYADIYRTIVTAAIAQQKGQP